MNNGRLMIPFLLLGILLATATCGKKGPPFLPQKEFSAKADDLKGEWRGGNIFLTGNISGYKRTKKAKGLVEGCRVYYAQYPLESPPCNGCPIEYHGYHAYGPEVVTEEGFRCKLSGKIRGQIYFFKVHLIGPGETLGPASDRVKVIVK